MRRALLAVLVFAGCGPLASLPIALSTIPPTDLPAAGRLVDVRIVDDRVGDSAGWIGLEQGGDISRDMVLEGGGSLASRLISDVVASLRARGYRAEAREGPARSDATALDIRIVRFALTVQARGFKQPAWHASWAFLGRASVANTASPVWTELVLTIREEHVSTWSLGSYRQTMDGYYRQALAELVDRFAAAVAVEEAR